MNEKLISKFELGLSIFFYFIYFFGALWYRLGLFQEVMKIAAGPLLIFSVGCLIAMHISQAHKELKRNLILWFSIILLSGFFVEYVGVNTGFPFGHYHYTSTLQPQIAQIPIAIAFAWVGITLGALGISDFLKRRCVIFNSTIVFLIFSALLILILDMLMEPVATQLQYWQWASETIPIHNYIAWFILGNLFVFLGIQLRIVQKQPFFLSIHFFNSQILFFLILIF